jgi:hypothetical protein
VPIAPLAALSSNPGPYAAVIAVGFLIGIYGHIARTRILIVAGILIVGTVSGYFAFVVGKLGQ